MSYQEIEVAKEQIPKEWLNQKNQSLAHDAVFIVRMELVEDVLQRKLAFNRLIKAQKEKNPSKISSEIKENRKKHYEKLMNQIHKSEHEIKAAKELMLSDVEIDVEIEEQLVDREYSDATEWIISSPKGFWALFSSYTGKEPLLNFCKKMGLRVLN